MRSGSGSEENLRLACFDVTKSRDCESAELCGLVPVDREKSQQILIISIISIIMDTSIIDTLNN